MGSRHLERRRVKNAKRKGSVGSEKELTFSIPTMYSVFLDTMSFNPHHYTGKQVSLSLFYK